MKFNVSGFCSFQKFLRKKHVKCHSKLWLYLKIFSLREVIESKLHGKEAVRDRLQSMSAVEGGKGYAKVNKKQTQE